LADNDTLVGSKTLKRAVDAVAGTRVGNKDPEYMKNALNKLNSRADKMASPSSYKRGGKVRKTGLAKVHQGEKVLTHKQQSKSRGAHK
jgi:hypothetical protein